MSPPTTSHWVELCRAAGAPADAPRLRTAGAELLRRWAEPHRRYHDTRHLGDVLGRLDDLAGDGVAEAGDPAVRLAAWYHDAVHRGRAGEDERDSAELARAELRALGMPAQTPGRVAALVLTTTSHDAGHDPAAAALCDADLAVLGRDAAGYAAYRADIRREYAAVDDAAFAAGRAAVLRALLDRPRLFATAAGQRRWEAAARRNVVAELTGLDATDGSAHRPG